MFSWRVFQGSKCLWHLRYLSSTSPRLTGSTALFNNNNTHLATNRKWSRSITCTKSGNARYSVKCSTGIIILYSL